MKKSIVLIILLIATALCSCNNSSDVWKDTHRILGNGTYEIFNHTENEVKVKGISNSQYHQCIVDKIIAMEEKEQNLYVYGTFTEHDVYTVINLNENKAKYFVEIEKDDVLGMTNINDMIVSDTFELLQTYDDFNEEEKVIFRELKMKN